MLIAIWVAFELLAFAGGVAYIIWGPGLTKPEEILIPIVLSAFGSDLVIRLRAGADYLSILPRLLSLAARGRPLRISFATLIRIQVGNQYLLVKSKRIPQQFQPAGGVIKFYDSTIRNRFHLKDDNAFQKQDGDELRLQFEPRSLWAVFSFLKWFDSRLGRELSPDREFAEELLDTSALPHDLFSKPRFEYVERVIPKITYGVHFKIHELFLFEIFRLVPSDVQKLHLESLANAGSTAELCFLTADTITRDGYDGHSTTTKIGSQTKYIL